VQHATVGQGTASGPERPGVADHAFEPVPELKRRGRAVPEELAEICSKALEKKPQSRFRTARTMRRALEKAARKLELPVPKLARATSPEAAPRQATPSRPDLGAVPALPGARHTPPGVGPRVTRSLIRLLVALVLLSLGLAFTPGARPGAAARRPEAARRAQQHFLRGLTACETGRVERAVTLWRSAGNLDPTVLPWVRDHAAQAFDRALLREDLEGARAYLRLVRWADPGWERGLERVRRFRDRWPPLDAAPASPES